MSSEKQIFTLKQVALSIQKVLAERYHQTYWVQAEMFKLNYTGKGHCFPELVHKEDGKIVTEMRGTIWSVNFERISKNFAEIVKEPLRDGINLLFLVKISFHPIYGLSLEILDIDPTYSLGELQKEREETLKKLKQEGILDANQKLPFPLLPKRLAIISADSSKGFKDFCSLISKNVWKYKFVYKLFPAQLNGDAAILSIKDQLNKIEALQKKFDAVLIIRGGGGEIGLSCYNNFDLSKAIATFPLPILTGIGHSTNNTVSEMIAFQSFITPSDLADFLLQTFREFDLSLKTNSQKIKNETHKLIQIQKNELRQEIKSFKYNSSRLLKENHHLLNIKRSEIHSKVRYFSLQNLQKVENLSESILRNTRFFLKDKTQFFEDTKHYLLQEIPKIFQKNEELLQVYQKNLDLLDPKQVLKRGYSIVLNKNQKLANLSNTKVGDELEIINFDTKITTEVKKISPNG